MAPHESPQTESEADAAFERLLLRSAAADQLPESATREAWAKFASASATVALVATAAPGLSGLLHTARRASLKWLAVGALGGSAITAAWMGSRSTALSPHAMASSQPAELAATSTLPPRANSEVPRRAEPAAAEPSANEITHQGERAAEQPAFALKRAPTRPSSAPKPSETTSHASLLAAEIAALDAVQKAVAARDFPRAVRLVDDYQREFPQGQLAPDADALAIEALAALGNRAELERRAARFSSRYPKDPHRARVTALAEP